MADTLVPTPIPVAGLRVVPRHFDGGIAVHLHGELDMCTADAVDAAMRELSYQYDADQVVIDVTALTFIDLRGIDSLRRASRLWRRDERLTIRGAAPLLDRLLLLIGCKDRFRRIGAREPLGA